MKIIVWTKPDCVQCDATKRYLVKHDIPFETHLMNSDMIEKFKGEGFMSAPIVETSKETWAGFRLSRLENLVAEYKSEQVHKHSA